MPEIYIRCPRTNLNLGTGIVVDNLEAIVLIDNSVTCPHCNEIHTWSNQDGFFLD